MVSLKKGVRITGASRAKLAEDLTKQYAKGASIRELADANGRSYGFIHRVLTEADVPLRGRGGATRRKTTAAGAPTAPGKAKAPSASKAPASKRSTRSAKAK
jgi:hypothetical protein